MAPNTWNMHIPPFFTLQILILTLSPFLNSSFSMSYMGILGYVV